MSARPLVLAVLVALVAAACGGGSDPLADDASTSTSAAAGSATTVTVPDGSPGSVVASERVAVRGIEGFRITYLSEGVTGDIVEVTGLVLVPQGVPPAEGWPVVAWAHGTTGGADVCAPSRVADGSSVATALGGLAEAGYVVAATDYEGIGGPGPHPYLNGPSQARSVVDSVRAARGLVPGTSSRWLVAGHSQGGHAALWTAQEAPTYAPELELVGAIAVAPASGMPGFPFLAGGPGAAFLLLTLAGFLAAEPAVDPATVMTPAGLAAMEVVEEQCIGGLALLYESAGAPNPLLEGSGFPGTPFGDYLVANEPGRVAPSVPLFVLHGDRDRIVRPELTEILVERLCSLDAAVEYRTYPEADHGSVIGAASGDAREWIAARFRGPLPDSARTC